MSGKPAARQGDMTQYGGSIVQGSAGVRIGAPTGVACSVCPGGVTSGHPVNPLLGAKVLPGETDLALPGPLPFILSRTYSSYRTKTPAPVGSLGPGWKMPADIRLQLRDNTLILSDNGGRSLYFEHLFPGEDGYSRSESLWLVRGGVLKLDEGHRLAALWQALPEELRLSPHRYLATNSPQGPWWLLGWCERVPEADEVLPAPLPPYRVLTGLVDRFGRTQTFHREAGGEFSGEITGVTDGAGRHFRLVLTTQAQRAEEARQQASSGGTEPSAFPDTLPDYTEYGRDNGIRLSAVWLTHDPEYPENLPAAPLVRYGWTPRGELAAVYDRSGKQVRSFTYDDKYRGRMVAHHRAGRPEIRYRYDSDGRVTEQLNPAGLSYTYQYEKDRITITDSLDRREVLHTQGEGGLKRVVKKEHADGSVTQSQFDAVGRLKAQTDAAGRTTEYSPDVVTGLITRITTPDGRASAFYYNHHSQLTSATGTDTRTVVFEEYVDSRYSSGVWVNIFPLDALPEDNSLFEANRRTKRIYDVVVANTDIATTPLRKLAKKVLKPLVGRRDIYAVARELDQVAASVPMEEGCDVGVVIWGYNERERMPYSILESVELEFEGKRFFAPRDYDANLTAIFGDYMTLPPESERLPHLCRAYWKDEEPNG